ncbi:MAG: type I phosphomannose isomerase catalytic subunit [Alkaliphilus sp.]
MLYPLKLKKVFKERVWGGQYLRDSKTPIGESWEICDHEEGVSIVTSGALEGETITELMKRHQEALLGINNVVKNMRFPLLIKFIDANDKLSVQVHPKDDYAYKHENEPGKTEMWYIISAKPGARLVYGLKKHITKEIFKKAIDNNRIEETLNEVEVKKGDVFFIPAGMVHAIGEGIVIAEIQQNSNTTYRVYDWDRVGLDGKPRELHIEKALDVIDFDLKMENRKEKKRGKDNRGVKESDNWNEEGQVRSIHGESSRSTVLATCPYFTTELLEIEQIHYGSTDKKSFHVLIGIEGDFKIKYEADGKKGEETIRKEETVLMPACIEKYTIIGKGIVIKTYL